MAGRVRGGFAPKDPTLDVRVGFKFGGQNDPRVAICHPFRMGLGAKNPRGSISSDLSTRASRDFLSKDPLGAGFLTKNPTRNGSSKGRTRSNPTRSAA